MASVKNKSKKREKPRKGRKRARGVLDLPKATEERMAEGRAERESVPLEAHSAWAAPDDRPDPVGILEKQDATRVPELVPIRHGRMIVSAFTFYRGSAAIMAWDLSCTPTTGLRVQCCGDAHLSNFGIFAAPDRRVVFDLNDFDETLAAPLTGTSSAWWRASSSPRVATAIAARSSEPRRAPPPRPIGRRWPRRRGCASWMSGTRGLTLTR